MCANQFFTITAEIHARSLARLKQRTLQKLHMAALYISWGWVVCLYLLEENQALINFDMRCEMIIKFLFRNCGKYSCICLSSVHILWICIHTFAPIYHGGKVVQCLVPIKFRTFYRSGISCAAVISHSKELIEDLAVFFHRWITSCSRII